MIRDQKDYERIANYMIANPVRWDKDEENPGISDSAQGRDDHTRSLHSLALEPIIPTSLCPKLMT
ncbi:MAG: hypothetical protein A2X25_00780 [Chloroflexi bacterium GWB2_49_20]|nr:MAG: hypothetical protein A2X25_00780 [Chloroflexi bacterium GWB2_49_20]OGN77554.1 MAG: hypothetical protein A2X26_02320 [Chloroflexi bacterium GWC2_49_37]OGN83183.1 MAG: hypothetical protein A2X27_13400 [Chloroflexi bacterium GWD2_49_16]